MRVVFSVLRDWEAKSGGWAEGQGELLECANHHSTYTRPDDTNFKVENWVKPAENSKGIFESYQVSILNADRTTILGRKTQALTSFSWTSCYRIRSDLFCRKMPVPNVTAVNVLIKYYNYKTPTTEEEYLKH